MSMLKCNHVCTIHVGKYGTRALTHSVGGLADVRSSVEVSPVPLASVMASLRHHLPWYSHVCRHSFQHPNAHEQEVA